MEEEEEKAVRAITDRSAGSRPGRPCSSEPRVPRPNSDAHHFSQFWDFSCPTTHGRMDKRIHLELRGRQPSEVSLELEDVPRSSLVDRWGSSWGRLGGPSRRSTSHALNLPQLGKGISLGGAL